MVPFRRDPCDQNRTYEIGKVMWTDEELRHAELIWGPEKLRSDTYRLHIPKTGEKDGKWVDVPGWMVGDEAMVKFLTRAAKIIRERLAEKYAPLI